MYISPNGHSDDTDLVLAALIGDLHAFDELVLRYRPAMLIVAEQIVGTEAGAEDVAQDALLLAYKALPQLDDVSRFPSWLYAITRNRALRYVKENGQRPPPSELDYFIMTRSASIVRDPAQIYDTRDEHNALRDAIKTLPQEYQVVIGLYYWDEMPQQDIAEFTGLPLTTVKWRLHKARRLLRRYVTQREEKDRE